MLRASRIVLLPLLLALILLRVELGELHPLAVHAHLPGAADAAVPNRDDLTTCKCVSRGELTITASATGRLQRSSEEAVGLESLTRCIPRHLPHTLVPQLGHALPLVHHLARLQ